MQKSIGSHVKWDFSLSDDIRMTRLFSLHYLFSLLLLYTQGLFTLNRFIKNLKSILYFMIALRVLKFGSDINGIWFQYRVQTLQKHLWCEVACCLNDLKVNRSSCPKDPQFIKPELKWS